MKLITSFDWIDFSKLNGIEDEISEIMSSEQAKAVLGDTRYKDISEFVKTRVEQLERFALNKSKSATVSAYANKMGNRCIEVETALYVSDIFSDSAEHLDITGTSNSFNQ